MWTWTRALKLPWMASSAALALTSLAAHVSGADPAPTFADRLQAQVGDGAVSLSWRDEGAKGVRYSVDVSPTQPQIQTHVEGTRALVRGLANGTQYTVSLVAQSGDARGSVASLQVTPAAAELQVERPLDVQGDPGSPSGIFDASIVRRSPSETWLAYSGVDYSTLVGVLVQDVSTELARSDDGGQSYTHVQTIGAARKAVVSDVLGLACGKGEKCSGRWVYETPALVDDTSEPDAARRWKLFAHRYFLYPPKVGAATVYALGSIVMWTAPAPEGPWSSETSVLGWNLTPAELVPKTDVNRLHPDLAKCLAIAEGGVAVTENGLDFVFACTEPAEREPFPQKIVLLRSTDHAQSFAYVSTLLRAEDARILGASHFTAPSLLPSGGDVPVLIVTPALKTLYAGCVVIPFSDPRAGRLFRDARGVPLGLLGIKTLPGHTGGACAADGGLDTLIMNDLDRGSSKPFRLLRRESSNAP